jgi:hypothetical protein
MGGRITANVTLVGIECGGEDGEVKLVRFAGKAVLTCEANATKFPVNASSIQFLNASLVFTTSYNRLFDVDPSSSELLKLMVRYEDVTKENSESLSRVSTTFLQSGNVTFPPFRHWMCWISCMGQDDCFAPGLSIVKRLIVSLPSLAN